MNTSLRQFHGYTAASRAEPSLPCARSPHRTVAGQAHRAPKRILVLGATSGIAEACCRLWAARGDSLYLVARNPEKLAAVAADVRTRGAAYVETAVADLDDTHAHPELLAHAINSLAGLDIAFLALGVLGRPGRRRSAASPRQIASCTPTSWRR